jgi:predicted NUDIX family phosphoesterase
MEREQAETNEAFRQVIPYVLIKCDDRWLVYQRCKGGEPRLDAKWSMGIGGHMEETDLTTALARELKEEVAIGSRILKREYKGLIALHSTPVDRVHIGVVYVYTIEEPYVCAIEPELINLHFRLPMDIAEDLDLEHWSRILYGEVVCK